MPLLAHRAGAGPVPTRSVRDLGAAAEWDRDAARDDHHGHLRGDDDAMGLAGGGSFSVHVNLLEHTQTVVSGVDMANLKLTAAHEAGRAPAVFVKSHHLYDSVQGTILDLSLSSPSDGITVRNELTAALLGKATADLNR